MKKLLALALSVPLLCSASLFMWIDDNGLTHISSEMPPPGVKFRRADNPQGLNARTPITQTSPSEYRAPARDSGLALRVQTMERCARAREREEYLTHLAGSDLMLVDQDKTKADIAAAKKLIQENCT